MGIEIKVVRIEKINCPDFELRAVDRIVDMGNVDFDLTFNEQEDFLCDE